jgi:hypothetical protein
VWIVRDGRRGVAAGRHGCGRGGPVVRGAPGAGGHLGTLGEPVGARRPPGHLPGDEEEEARQYEPATHQHLVLERALHPRSPARRDAIAVSPRTSPHVLGTLRSRVGRSAPSDAEGDGSPVRIL